MVNKAILLGYVGKVYEMRHTSGGDPVANLSLATTEKWTSKTGQKQEKTEWHRLVAFNPLATVVNNYIKKRQQNLYRRKIANFGMGKGWNKTQKYRDCGSGVKNARQQIRCNNTAATRTTANL